MWLGSSKAWLKRSKGWVWLSHSKAGVLLSPPKKLRKLKTELKANAREKALSAAQTQEQLDQASLDKQQAEAARDRDLDAAKRLAEQAEAVSKLYHPLFAHLGFLLVFLLGVVSMVGIPFLHVPIPFLHWPTVAVVIQGKTRWATTYLAERGNALDLSLAGSRLQLSRLTSEQSENLAELGKRLASLGGEPTLVHLRFTASGGGSGRARPSLSALVAPGSELRVGTGRDELTVSVSGVALKGTVDVPAGARINWEPDEGEGDSKRQFEETDPDVVSFQAKIHPKVPFTVSVREPDQLDLLPEVEHELTFNPLEKPANPTPGTSLGLESATVQFADLQKTLSIPKGDYVVISLAAPGRLRLRRSPGSELLDFDFEGKVSKLRCGRQDRPKNCLPKLWEEFMENSALRAFGSVLVSLWALLLWILKIKEG